jgi:uroporphyrinogen III methyltransferase/synthase
LMVDYVPEEYTSQAMVDGLRSILDEPGTQKILVPRAESAPDVFSVLRDEGFGINEVPAYRTLRGEGNIELIEKLLQEKRIHILTFTSASTVTNFVDMLRADDLQNLLEGVTVACIGPITAGTAQKLGIPVHVVAKEYTVEGMIASILEYINRERGKQ